MRTNQLIIFLALAWSSLLFASDSTIHLATVEYPPYYGESLPHGGPVTEIIVAAFKHQGYHVKRQQMPWSRALKEAQRGTFDGIYTAWYRKDREVDFIYSKPLVNNELVFYARKGEDISFKGFESLKGYQIGVVRDYALPPELDKAKLQLQLANSDKINLNKLFAKRVDLVLIDRAQGKHLIKTQLPTLKGKLTPIAPAINTESNHLMISRATKNAQEKAKQFDIGLNAIRESGLLDEILGRHDF